MTTIIDVLQDVYAVQGKWTATVDGVTFSVQKVWPLFPPISTTVSASRGPVVLNEVSLVNVERDVSFKREHFTIRQQLLIQDRDLDRAGWIAVHFIPVVIASYDTKDSAGNGGVSLGETVANQTLRGGSPTVGVIERSEGPFAALELLMDVEIQSGIAFS